METTLNKTKFSARNSELVKRGNSFRIDPRLIIIDWDTNERVDYGTEEEFTAFKESIKERGVMQNIKLFPDADGNWHLRHGFRRMKAVLELIAEGTNIESIFFDEVKNNEEQALIDHFVLNSGKNLNDVEMANGLKKLKALTGIENVAELARRVSLPYQKVITLLDFADKAGTQIQQSILKGETSFSTGKKIVNSAKSITEQNQLLDEGKAEARRQGKNKVRVNHIPIDHPVVTTGTSFDESLDKIMKTAKKMEKLDNNFYNRVANLINAVKIGSPEEEIMLLFIP